MLGRNATTAADDPGAQAVHPPGVAGHYLGRAAVTQIAIYVLGDASVRLGHQDGFGIGGALERIAIPYSAVVMPEVISPSTVNLNYIDLPVPSEHFDAISILKANGENSVWDQRPFKQAIAEIRVADGRLIAKAYPNEFIVHLFSTLHPLLMYLNRGDPNKLDVGDA